MQLNSIVKVHESKIIKAQSQWKELGYYQEIKLNAIKVWHNECLSTM